VSADTCRTSVFEAPRRRDATDGHGKTESLGSAAQLHARGARNAFHDLPQPPCTAAAY
jgi:hypothetical protein